MTSRPLPASPAIAALLLAGAGLLNGCTPHPTDSVLTELRSPDGNSTAYVIERATPGAHPPAISYVIVLRGLASPFNRPDLAQSAAFAATRGYSLRLRWTGLADLQVSCDACDLQPADIHKQLDHIDTVKVSYTGLPSRPATQ